MRKILSLVLAAVLLLAAVPVTAGAAGTAKISAGTDASYPGNMVCIPVRGENLQNLASLDLELYYDSTVLSYSHYAPGSLLEDSMVSINGNTVGVVKGSVASVSGISGSDILFWMYFTIREDAKPGTSRIILAVGDAYDTGLQPASVSGASGAVVVQDWPQATQNFYIHHNVDNTLLCAGDTATLTLYNSWGSAFASADLTLEYDSSLLSVEAVSLCEGMTVEGAVYSVNQDTPGTVYLSYATINAVSPYELLRITLKAKADVTASTLLTYRAKDVYTEKLVPYLPYEGTCQLDLKKAPEQIPAYKLYLDMKDADLVVGETCSSQLKLEAGAGVAAANFFVTYDPAVWECVSVSAAASLASNGGMVIVNDGQAGKLRMSYVNEQGNPARIDVLDITWRPLASPKKHAAIQVSAEDITDKELKSLSLDCVGWEGCIYAATEKQPSCTAGGGIAYACAGCGNQYVVETSGPLGHTDTQTVVPPSCEEPGYTQHDCERCDYSYRSDWESALGHTYGQVQFLWNQDHSCTAKRTCTRDSSHVQVIPCTVTYQTDGATCTIPGNTTYTAAIMLDGVTYTDQSFVAGQPLGHAKVTDAAKAPTCTQEGLTEGSHCGRCGEILTAQQTIPKTDHSWDGGTVTKNPTPEEAGERLYRCKNCTATKRESIPAAGHSHSYVPSVMQPTCTEQGYTTYTCACGETYTQDYTQPTGHSFGAWETEKAATGKEPGAEKRVCACGETETRQIPKLNNPFVDVAESKFFFEPVLWAYYNDITTGKDATHFNPSGDCTRAQVVTFLWRAAGKPAPESADNPFPDVPGGKYYTDAVLWAVEQGITAGFKDGTFGPGKTCTRAQIVTFLWRYAQQPEPESLNNPFPDVSVGAYYGKAVLWAVENGITGGFKDGTFGPDKTCTRDQIVTFLYRYMVE